MYNTIIGWLEKRRNLLFEIRHQVEGYYATLNNPGTKSQYMILIKDKLMRNGQSDEEKDS